MVDGNGSRNKHVAVLAFPFASHPGSLLSLIRRLANAAPHVNFSFFSTVRSYASSFSVYDATTATRHLPEYENVWGFDFPDGTPEGYDFGRNDQMEEIGFLLEVAKENFREGVKVAENVIGIGISCVMSDAFMWFSGEIAEEFRVPWIPVWTGGANSLSLHVYTKFIRQTVGMHGITGRENAIITCVPGFSQLRLSDLPAGIIHGWIGSVFSDMLYEMGQFLHKSDVLVVNSIEELDPAVMKDLKLKFKNILNVGSFSLKTSSTNLQDKDTYGCISWLDKQENGTVAYIGFGTGSTPPPHEIKALAEALEATKIPFIWSLKDEMKTHLPKGFSERITSGKIVSWAPQVEILNHESVGVFLSHCGWGSVMESITAGVPIIGRPFLGDQQLNSWMVEEILKIGVRINGDCFTKDSTIRVLELILNEEEGKKVKDQSMFYKQLALQATQPNGSATVNFHTLLQIICGESI